MDTSQPSPLPDFWQSVRGEILQRRGAVIPPRQSGDPIPLSPQQERLWFAERIAPGRAVQNLAAALRLSGPLDISAVQRALNEILSRHEILRTSIEVNNEGTWQRIHSPQPMHLSVTDLRSLTPAEQEQRVGDCARALAAKPMDLKGGALWSVELLQLGSEEHILLRVFHHFIFDHWSGAVFLRELAVFYNGFVTDGAVLLPPLPVQYADYTLWQRSRDLGSSEAFWQDVFRGKMEPLQLPTHQAFSSASQASGAMSVATFSAPLLAELGGLSKVQGVSLFVVLLTGFNLLLHRRTGQRDLIVCTPVAGRSRLELRKLIGYFNNIMPIRTKIEGDATFAQLVQHVSQSMLAAQPHQEVPFQNVAKFPAEEGVSLKRALFSLLNTPGTLPKMSGLTLQPLELDRETTDFGLAFYICPAEIEWTVKAQYRSDLFTPAALQSLLQDYLKVLGTMCANPMARLSILDGDSMWTRLGSRIRSVLRRQFRRNETGE